MKIESFSDVWFQAWDSFCQTAYQATFLHSRRFLSYHGDKFTDLSLLIKDQEDRLIGLFPAAQHPNDAKTVVSHPGITYGGLIHSGKLVGETMLDAISLVSQHYTELGYQKLIYKRTPSIYHGVPSDDDSYALFRLNAKRVRCDLSSTIDVAFRRDLNQRRKRALKKARASSLNIRTGDPVIADFWSVLRENLERKHNATPVHSLSELQMLYQRFPEHMLCVGAYDDTGLQAGVLLFITQQCIHAQYIASTDKGYEISALDLVFDYCINLTVCQQKRWFDFGISTESSGQYLNKGLYQFKTEFGGGGTVYEFFEMDLVSGENDALK
jgi:hypothetical protein